MLLAMGTEVLDYEAEHPICCFYFINNEIIKVILSNYTYYKPALRVLLLLSRLSCVHPPEFRVDPQLISERFILLRLPLLALLTLIHFFPLQVF